MQNSKSNGDGVKLAQRTSEATGPEPIPSTGQRTKAQVPSQLGVLSDLLPGFIGAPGAIYSTWRAMRKNPTIAIARAASTAPIRAAQMNMGTGDGRADDVTDDQIQLIKDMLIPQWPVFIRQALFALDYGWKGFEKIYEVREVDGRARNWLRKMKPLRVDTTLIRVEKNTGDFMGLKQKETFIPPENSFVYTFDGEDDDCYGRSRHENIRQNAWSPWNDVLKRMGQYVTKSAGVIPLVRYSPGKVNDLTGAQVDSHEHAISIVRALGRGEGIIHPIEIADFAEDLVRAGGKIDDLLSWQIKFLEVAAGHGEEFINMMKHFESLMLRGWLVPERAVTEGRFGTKAEAGVHADLAILIAQEVLDDILLQYNLNVVDPIVALNFGPDMRGAIVLQAMPLGDDTADFIREMMKEILTNPVNSDLLGRFVNFEKMVEIAGLPEGADDQMIIRDPDPDPDDELDPEDEEQALRVSAILSASAAFSEN